MTLVSIVLQDKDGGEPGEVDITVKSEPALPTEEGAGYDPVHQLALDMLNAAMGGARDANVTKIGQ